VAAGSVTCTYDIVNGSDVVITPSHTPNSWFGPCIEFGGTCLLTKGVNQEIVTLLFGEPATSQPPISVTPAPNVTRGFDRRLRVTCSPANLITPIGINCSTDEIELIIITNNTEDPINISIRPIDWASNNSPETSFSPSSFVLGGNQSRSIYFRINTRVLTPGSGGILGKIGR